ncbi:protein TolR [Photobacterium carnosum]|uniref:Tol-Pal system protein TolR n=1 Tax=Photobacterium carnosum TaxID=2023717 RepID=A0A2N4UXB3_9GAMM|nr:protein TolR [Photobacterium carnosum]KAE8178778.1 protein TolR [Photobacterium carnosum]MBY3787094.1 protein TolR [Photobacterium carnosum]MCD9493811.1 protein TolR [Photobacterium carnosum]MCD9497419.1 protein TolR [Photobacterium carnosum]MCD9513832.1 protein TolR [Photobacterium carnosum]
MAYQPKKRKITAEINVVPYIDVMLVLLIIFMVTAPFVSQGVDVDLPKTQTAETVADMNPDSNTPPIIVEVDKDGHLGVSINNAEMAHDLSLDELVARVKAELAANPKTLVMVGGDGRTPYSNIVETLDALSHAGVGSVGLMTDPLDKPGN